MVFICGRVVDEDREPLKVVYDGVISADVQRDYDIIWSESEEVAEVL